MYKGENVSLRTVAASDLPLIKSWENDIDFNSKYNTFGLNDENAVERNYAENGLLSKRSGVLLIVTPNGVIVGFVSYHLTRYGPNEASEAYNIGISLASEHRGKGYGVEAQKLLASYLLSTYAVMRIEATTDIENIPEQRALEKAGFTRDGVLRKAQWRAGEYHDMVVYSKLRGE